MYRSQSGGCFPSFFKSNVKLLCRDVFWLAALTILFLSSNATHAQSCAPLPSGLVSWWRGEGNAFDQIGANNGTLIGNTSFADGKVAGGFVFDGDGDYVALGNAPSLQLQNLTIEAWIKRSSTSAVSSGTNARGNFLAYGQGGYAFYLGSDSHLYLSKVGTVAWAGSAVITDTNFHHVVVTKNNNLASFYIDGAIDAIVTFNDSFTFTQPVVIGAEADNLGNNSFLGRIDELAVYDRALTGAEIQGIYSAGASGKCATNAAPFILAQPVSKSVYTGASTNFNIAIGGTPPFTYQWTFNGSNDLIGQTNSSLSLTNIQLANGGNYSVRVSNAFGSVTSSIASLSVYSPTSLPLINVDFASGSLTKTGFAATGQTLADYWNPFNQPNGAPLNLKLVDGAPTSATVTMQGGGGGTTLTHPDVMYQTIVYRLGNPIAFAVTNLPTGQYAFYLYGHAGANNANTSFELTVGGANYGTNATVNGPNWSLTNWVEGAQYVVFRYVSVTNGGAPVIITCRPGQNGYAYVNGMQIQGLDPTPAIKTGPVSQSVMQGSNAVFSVDAAGVAPLAYQWLFEGTNISEATNASLVLTNIQLVQAGTYGVIVTNRFGAATSSNATLTVLLPPPCEPVPSGLVNFWSGEGNVDDRVGILNGYLFGGTTFAPGKVGQAFSFDGINDSVTNAVPGLTNILDSYTMEFWAYPTAGRASTTESTSGVAGGSNQRYAIFPWQGTAAAVGAGISVGINGVSVFEHAYGYMPSLLVYDAPISGWTHVAVVYTNRTPSLYINGVYVRTGLTSLNPSCPSTWLGERGPVSANQGYYAGLLDEYAIYNRALSATEIERIYNAGMSGKCAPQIPPFIVAQPADRTVFVSDVTAMNVVAGGTAPLAYQWQLNGINLPDQTTNSLSLINLQLTNSGNYTVVITNAFGSVTSSVAVLTVLSPSSEPLYNVDFAAGSPSKTGFAAIGQTPTDFWNAFGNASGVPFSVKRADGTSTGVVIIQNNAQGGTTLSHPDAMYRTAMYRLGTTITLTVTNLPTGQYGFYLYGHAGADNANTSFQLTVGGTNYGTKTTVNGPGWSLTNWVEGAQYIAFRDVNVTNGGAPVLITCSPGQNGYTYVNGIQIQANNPAPAIRTQPISQTVVMGSNALFTATAVGTLPLAYQWQFDGTNLATATNASLSLTDVQLAQAGPYSLTVSNAFGSVVSSNAILNVVVPVPCEPTPIGAVNWWGGEGNGEDRVDNLTNYLYGGTTFAPGKIGQAFSFDGMDDSVTNAVPGLTNILDSYTMEFWAYPTAGRASTTENTLGVAGAGNQRYAIFPWQGTAAAVGAGVSVGTNGVSVFEHAYGYMPSLLVYDTAISGWTHVAVVYTNRRPVLYLNGVLVRAGLTSANPSCPSTWLGERGPLTANQGFYAGLLDEYSIYDRALSAGEIQGIYNAGFVGKCSPQIAPYIVEQPQNQSTFVSGIATMKVAARGNLPRAYQWRLNGIDIPGQTMTSLAFTRPRLTDTGEYTVVVTNAFGSVTSSIATLTVSSPPRVPLINVDFSADSLSKTGFAAAGLTSSDYWNGLRNTSLANMKQVDGTPTPAGIMVQGQTGTTELTHPDIMYQTIYYLQGSGIILTVTNLPTAKYDLYLYGHGGADNANTSFELTVGGTTYGTKATVNGPSWSLTNWVENAQYVRFRDVNVTNGGAPLIITCRAGQNGYTYVNGMQIEQHNPAPTLLTQPISKTAIVGTSPVFAASADGVPPLTYQWQFNGTNIGSATNATLTLTNVQFDQAGEYSIVVSNDLGFATSSNATLTVVPPPPCVPPNSGIMNWWAGESDVTDQVGNLTGFLYGGVSFAPGAVGQGFSFDGISGSVTNATWGLTNVLDTYTMEFWAWPSKSRTATSQSGSGTQGNGGQSYAIFPCQGGSGTNAVGSGVSVGTNGVSVFENAVSYFPSLLVHNATITNWTHIAVVYSNRQPSLYLNGTLVRTGVSSARHSFPSTWLGERGPITLNQGFYRGLLDEYSIYNRALTAAEILNIFSAGLSGKCHTPVGPNIAVQPTNTFLNLSNSASFTVLAGGNYPLTYQWRFNGSDIEFATNSSLTISKVLPSNAGLYSVAITNPVGFAISSNAQLKVKVMSILGNGGVLTNPAYTFNKTVTVQLQSFFNNSNVFYTLDGSSPSLSSLQYSGPFVVNQSGTLRARAYSSDLVESGESDPISFTLPPSYNLSLGTDGGGSVSANPASGPYLSNTVVTLTATPAAGWTFLKWLGDAAGSSAITNVTMTRNKTAQAIFGTTLSTTTAGGGTVMLNPSGGIYPYGSVVQLSAIPDAGNFFDSWGNAASGNMNPLTFILTNANPTVSSLFAPVGGEQSALTVVPVGLGQVNVSPSANVYSTGSEVTVTATPNSGQFFVGWSGDATGTANPLSVTIDANKLIYANFTTRAQLTLANPTTIKAEGAQLLISGYPGDKYSLGSSTNLFDWISLVTLSNAFGTATFTDITATNANRKFYRTSNVP